jgi:uncharacterized coiled-coil protein SlyX
LNSYTSSNTSTTALNAFTASADGRLTNLEATSASVNNSVTSLNTSTASQQISIDALNVVSASNLGRLSNLELTSASVNTSITNLNTVSSSNLGRLSNLELTSASVNISIGALNTSTASQQNSIDALNTVSASNLGRLTNLETTSASVNVSVAALNTYSSSLKTAFELTGSNVVVLGDFTVRGTTTSVESNTIQLGDNIIELNGTGAANGGLLVKDPTAPNTVSGSLLWDSTNDYWKAGALGAESKLLRAGGDNVVTESAQILFTGITGYDTYSGSVATSFSASNASITSLSASVSSVTGEFSSSVATSFSASAASQLSLSSSFASSQTAQNDRLGLIEASTGSLNSFTSSIDTTIKTKLNVDGVVSGSSQITYASISSIPAGIVSGSSQVISLLPTGTVSGSSQVISLLPAGTVSGSIQVDITQTTGFSTFSASIETRIQTIDGGTY